MPQPSRNVQRQWRRVSRQYGDAVLTVPVGMDDSRRRRRSPAGQAAPHNWAALPAPAPAATAASQTRPLYSQFRGFARRADSDRRPPTPATTNIVELEGVALRERYSDGHSQV